MCVSACVCPNYTCLTRVIVQSSDMAEVIKRSKCNLGAAHCSWAETHTDNHSYTSTHIFTYIHTQMFQRALNQIYTHTHTVQLLGTLTDLKCNMQMLSFTAASEGGQQNVNEAKQEVSTCMATLSVCQPHVTVQ